jgi:multiple sugar transport system substrate-binding protein
MDSKPTCSPLQQRLDRRGLLRVAAVAGGLGSLAALAGSTRTTAAAQVGSNASGTLNVWHYFNVAGQQSILKEWATLFNQQYPQVEVKYTYVEFQDLSKKIIAAAGAKQGPDVIIYGGSDLSAMYKVGALKSMQPYWGQYADAQQFPDGVITKFNGEVYGVKGYVNLVAFWYNQDILNDVGVQPPTSIDQVTPALAQVAAAGKNYVPLVLTGQPSNQGDWTAYPWLTGYGFSYDNPDAAAIQQAFSLAETWSSQGYLPKDAVSWGQSETFDRWTVGDVAFMQNGNWNIGSAKDQAKFDYGIVAMPTGPQTGSIFLGGEAGWIGAFTSNPELAWAYLQGTYSQQGDIIPLRDAGSIPARADLASAPELVNEPLLVPFATEVNTRGAEYPPKGGDIVAAQLVVAQNWSSVIAGQKSAADAAADTVTGINNAPTS